MKTPREILFERHQAALPKLYAVRRQALATLSMRKTASSPDDRFGAATVALLETLWLELFWRPRRAWTVLTALWLVLLAANLQLRSSARESPATHNGGGDVARAVEEQRRVLAELMRATESSPRAQAINRPPGRRSEGPGNFKAC